MSSLIEKLSVHWDLWIGQYRAFFPIREEDLKACARLMEGMTDRASDRSAPERTAGLPMRLAACRDSQNGEIVACLHLVDALQLKTDPEKAGRYHLHLFDEEGLESIAALSDLVIRTDYLKTQAPAILMSHCFIEILKAGGQAILMLCDPGHFSIYKRLGMRPVGPLQKMPGGDTHIPMIFIPDQDYLSIIHSPVLPMLRGLDFNAYLPLCQWYYQLLRENSELQIGSAFYPDSVEDMDGQLAITEDLSRKGRETLLRNAMVIKCREGEILIKENDGGKAFGFVREGLVNVVIGSKTVVLLGKGDIFGEIAFILNSKRTAQVIAASPDTEVVLFNESAIKRLDDEKDRTAIWRNLARVLAQRVMLTNKLLD